MTTEQTAQQLELAAQILRTGHPWGYRRIAGSRYKYNTPIEVVADGNLLIPFLATPPDNRPLHNPHNLTAEAVGVGYRLTVEGESPHEDADMWMIGSRRWAKCGKPEKSHWRGWTYRLPLSVPWPEPADPYAEPQTKTVPLGPEDVPPGSVIRGQNWALDWSKCWLAVLETTPTGVHCNRGNEYRFTSLQFGWQINRSIPLTGKWNPDAWEPCSKTIPA